ncbi:MAG: hypothetical protein IJG69_08765, partial [Spirochaetales bacterium]|nr:hypothetical protein [Spirochaetales bacterium]
VSMNIKTVRANVVIFETKTVPITYVVKGEPASGYMSTGEIESTPDSVLIAGRSTAISQVSEIKVDDENIDLTGVTDDLTYSFDIEPFLPSGIYFADPDNSGIVAVVVHVAPVETQTFDVDVSNITVEGEAEGYRIFVDDSEYSTVSLTLVGLKETIQKISASDLKGTVSVDDILSGNGLEEMSEGTYSVDVDWSLPSGVSGKGTVSVYVTVEKDN